MAKFLVHLTGGQSVVAYASDYGSNAIIDMFKQNGECDATIEFKNGTFRIDHIAGLEYLEDE